MTAWISTIQGVNNGEGVEASVDNRPISQLTQRTQYLYELLQAALSGQSLVARGVPVVSTVEVGDTVYYDSSVSKYDKGLAVVDDDPAVGPWYGADSSNVVGFVLTKDTNNIADIFIGGSLNVTAYLTAAGKTLNSILESGTFGTGGNFFLSSTVGGKLSKSRGAVSSFVGSIDASGRMTINPVSIGSNRDHTHYEVDLVPDEALTSATRGWLTADISNFPALDYTIPAGAVYGYNIEHADEDTLRSIFPPVPLNFFYVEKDGIGLDDTFIVINDSNIWWVNSSTDPWDVGAIPVPVIKLWITKIDQLGGLGSVISLESYVDDVTRLPIDIVAEGAVATSPAGGVIKLAAKPFTSNPTASEAATALKDVVGKVKTFGPIVSRVKPGAGISIISSNGDAANGFFGLCELVLEDAISLFGDSEVAVLNGAREDANNGLHYLVLPKSKDSSIRFKMKLGNNGGGTKIRFYLRLFAIAGGNIPTLTIDYRQMPAPAVGVASTVPLTDTASTDYTAQTAIALAANGHVLVQSAQIPASGNANSGDVFFIEIGRTGSTDGYTHDVGILEAYYEFE